MHHKTVRTLSLFLIGGSAVAAHGQIYKLHNVDLGVNAFGPFTKTLTSDSANVQETTNTTGFLFSLKEHPVPCTARYT